jgi:hypothetical protein
VEGFSWEWLAAQARALWSEISREMPDGLFSRRTATDLVRLARPVEPFNAFDLVAPVIGIAGLVLGLMLAGVAVASLGTLLASLLALGLLLTEVYGVTLEVSELRR